MDQKDSILLTLHDDYDPNHSSVSKFKKPVKLTLQPEEGVLSYWKSYDFIWTRTDLEDGEKKVMDILKCLADKNKDAEKVCFASNKYIAKVMGATDRKIARHFASLRKKGLITSTYHQGGYRRTYLHF